LLSLELTAARGSRPNRATFKTPPGARPTVVVEVTNRDVRTGKLRIDGMKRWLATRSNVGGVESPPQRGIRGRSRTGGRPAREHIGIDVHKKETQISILTEDGQLIERRVRTLAERFGEVLGSRPRARIVLEASTESEWVARCLEGLGHEVIVADPNFAPMYATRTRKVKTDRRDARALTEANVLGAYRPAHRLSGGQRHVRAQLAVRDALVRTRTRGIALSLALLRRCSSMAMWCPPEGPRPSAGGWWPWGCPGGCSRRWDRCWP
jgi:hypothetical protein